MSRRHVYVVDDEEPIRRSLRLMLATEGHAVTLFESGDALLDALAGLVPGALLLDLRMPGRDGFEVLRAIAARQAALAAVVMTGHGDLAVAAAALREGAAAFIEKPFTRAAAVAALDAAFLRLEDPAEYRRRLEQAARPLAALAADQRALVTRLAAGATPETIAAELGIGLAELEALRLGTLARLGLDDLKDAVRLAIAAGI